MDIFVGNLLFEAAEADVKKLFEGFGDVASAVVVMGKDKKKPKSRGFAFVQMPDEQQALAAIAALNGKEFMGRVLNVEPARPKTEAQRDNELKERRKRAEFSPVFNKPGTYKGGRRTRSYMIRNSLTEVRKTPKPRPRIQNNPMRWRKKEDNPKPWQKSPGEYKPWKKAEGESKPWKKTEGESKPWKRTEGDFKPWRKSEGGTKPWKKTEGESKPWKKSAGTARPWSKSSGRPQKSRFKSRSKPGGYKR